MVYNVAYGQQCNSITNRHSKSDFDINYNKCMTDQTILSFALASATTFIIYHHFLGIIMLRVRTLLCDTYTQEEPDKYT